MAKNRRFEEADALSLPVPSGTKSGDPLVIGDLACVATTDRRADGTASVDCDGAYKFTIDDDIVVGEIIYWHSGTPNVLNNDSSGGKRFGYALGTASSAGSGTTNVPVKIGY